MKMVFSFLLTLSVFFIACDDDSSGLVPVCGDFANVSTDLYDSATFEGIGIENASISEDCLLITVSGSGCDGSTWETTLYDSGAIAESFPVQRFLKLNLINGEFCDAVFLKDYEFDIRTLRAQNENTIILNLEGWEGSLLYEY